MSPSYLLDTSALAAHFLGEPGGAFVADCIRKGQAALCALTVIEFQLLLKAHGAGAAERNRVWSLCRGTLSVVHPVDETVAGLAVQLRSQASDRLPLADACIAACAARHGLILLHSDSHYAALPPSVEAIDIRSV
jgi:predicted nucleic acid-binding protein